MPSVSPDDRPASTRTPGRRGGREPRSCPENVDMVSISIAASSTDLARTPTWSSDDARGTTPARETLPNVGLKPTIPQNAAGRRIELPVSVPIAPTAKPAATAAADPPLEPPQIRDASQGFLGVPVCSLTLVPPNAYSWRVFVPSITAPARLQLATASASTALTDAGRRDPAVILSPSTLIRSFTDSGMPSRAPTSWPVRILVSDCRAEAIAPSASTVTNVVYAGSARVILFRCARVTATGDRPPVTYACLSCATDMEQRTWSDPLSADISCGAPSVILVTCYRTR